MRKNPSSPRLFDTHPELMCLLTRGSSTPARYAVSEIRCETVQVTMRDGVRLATDLYLPPSLPAPAVAMRTPYGRALDWFVGPFLAMARRGYAVVSQDVRGTGDSEPDTWDYYMYESEDGSDLVDWIARQSWFDGFLGGCGSSYIAQTQWCMALHPRMSTIVPEVGGLGVAINTAHNYMIFAAYARSVGKGSGKLSIPYTELERLILEETLAGGYFNEPLNKPFAPELLRRYPVVQQLPPAQAKRWLWEQYCGMTGAQRADFVKQALGTQDVTVLEVESLVEVFGQQISHDALTIPHPDPVALCRELHAPALIHTGWYDWGLNDALATWELLRKSAREEIADGSRLIITPSAHNRPGYHEHIEKYPELQHNHRTAHIVDLLLRWYDTVRNRTQPAWPRVIYYLMGANEWRIAADWPPPQARPQTWYLGAGGTLTPSEPRHLASPPDQYTYDPRNPTPTLGGSIVSSFYPPGSVDVSELQQRADVLTYTTPPLQEDLDIVGPLSLILHVASSAVDTDFCARLSDVFPDGRAIQLQNGMLRARYRNPSQPELLVPGRIYRLQIDMWATANRFKAGHRLRLDISSADFPRFDRNANRGGEPGEPIAAVQSIYHDREHPSHLLIPVLEETPAAPAGSWRNASI